VSSDRHDRRDDRRHPEDRTVDGRPYLSIPCWFGPLDDGTIRPLPSHIVHWLCPSVRPGPYTPGELLEVTVDVANHGPASAAVLATVAVYWADPTVGFAKPTFFGATLVAVAPRGGQSRTAAITGLIPASAPTHICLLARVTHPLDPAGPAANPIGDRHWAQRNLQSVVAVPGAPTVVPFNLGNPLLREARFELRLNVVRRERLAALAKALYARPAEDELAPLVGWPPGSQELVTPDGQLSEGLSLDVGEQRPMELVTGVRSELGRDELAAVELTLLAYGEQPVGSLGIVVRGTV
jgi:hypothetical protein